MRYVGKISYWNDPKGYGFITPNAGAKQVFFHIRSFRGRDRRPEIDQRVTFSLSMDKEGRPCAVKVYLLGEDRTGGIRDNDKALNLFAAAVFLLLLCAMVVGQALSPAILFIYLAASALSFLLYNADKTAAQIGSHRIAEYKLHLLALIGGWPGAMMAQQMLRHKSAKTSFRRVFWTTVAANCAVLVWLLSPFGEDALRWLLEHLRLARA